MPETMVKRRSFLGFLGGAVAAGPSAAKLAADDLVLKQAGFPTGTLTSGAAPMMPPAASAGTVAKFIKWVKRAGIPAWKMNDLRRQADFRRRDGLDPDLACLVSVSAGFKARTQRQRNLDRAIDFSLSSIGRNGARNAFDEKVRARFGDGLDWYD